MARLTWAALAGILVLQGQAAAEFQTAQSLINSPGVFNSARLYTNVQADTTNTPIEAFQAAINTNTSLLLGIWCSGTANITNELDALSTAIDKFGSSLADLVVGISVGSEDMYRASESGVTNDAGVGAGPDAIVKFINRTRKAIEGTPLADIPVGHVDTWSAWSNKSNKAVVEAVDWVGTDLYPFYEYELNNSFANAVSIFDDLHQITVNASQDKPVWITETGWPKSGDSKGNATTGVDLMADYWQEIGCNKLFGRINTWWYTLKDADASSAQMFAITDDDLSTSALFDLTCANNSGAPATVNAGVRDTTSGARRIAQGVSTMGLIVVGFGLISGFGW
ncbi:glucan 1,3-beta-glucosidase [Hypoxylon sp. FL1150]|nr:glucan 1,3-beta-glucosidase [Hypoxylon sp. FL1150]